MLHTCKIGPLYFLGSPNILSIFIIMLIFMAYNADNLFLQIIVIVKIDQEKLLAIATWLPFNFNRSALTS